MLHQCLGVYTWLSMPALTSILKMNLIMQTVPVLHAVNETSVGNCIEHLVTKMLYRPSDRLVPS